MTTKPSSADTAPKKKSRFTFEEYIREFVPVLAEKYLKEPEPLHLRIRREYLRQLENQAR